MEGRVVFVGGRVVFGAADKPPIKGLLEKTPVFDHALVRQTFLHCMRGPAALFDSLILNPTGLQVLCAGMDGRNERVGGVGRGHKALR